MIFGLIIWMITVSYTHLNMAVMFAMLEPGDKIMGMNLDHGGHLTHGSPVNMSGKYFDVAHYGVNADGVIDYDEVLRIAKEHKPKLIVAGASAYARTIDFKRFREIADEVGACLLYTSISNPDLIRCLNDVKYSFNSYTMNQTALACGVEAVEDKAYFEEGVRKIVETREWAKEELRKLGFVFPDAKANFIFARHPEVDANELFQALKENNIFVRHWNAPRIDQYLRITIGTREEMETLFDFLRTYIKEK